MKRKILIIVILLSLSICGCTQNSNQSGKSNKSPTSLLNVELTGGRLISELETIYTMKQKEKKSKSNQSKSNQSKSNQSKSNQSKSNQSNSKSEKLWERVNKKIKSLHQRWNRYESRSSIDDKKLSSINYKLNQLTEIAAQQKLLLTLVAVNQFNLQLAEISNIYNVKKAQIEKGKGYVRNVIYFTRLGKPKQKMLSNLAKLKEITHQLREREGANQAIKELKAAVNNLKTAVNNNKSRVVEIKGELILDKLQAIETG